MKDRAVVIGAIRACSDRKMLERTFDTFDIKDFNERYDLLIEAMYNPEIFFSNENPELIQKYELAVELFLTMEWKITEVYKRMEIMK